MSNNPFNIEEKQQEEMSFEQLIDLAKSKATKELTEKLLEDTNRLWAKLMSELSDENKVEKHFLRFIELKLDAARNNEKK